MFDKFALDREADMDQYEYTHIKQLLLWLEDEVLSACGDGDAIWISKNHTLEEIRKIAVDIFSFAGYWTIDEISIWEGKSILLIHNGQESMLITTSRDYPIPSWSQCTLVW